jgi:hypothetical protein
MNDVVIGTNTCGEGGGGCREALAELKRHRTAAAAVEVAHAVALHAATQQRIACSAAAAACERERDLAVARAHAAAERADTADAQHAAELHWRTMALRAQAAAAHGRAVAAEQAVAEVAGGGRSPLEKLRVQLAGATAAADRWRRELETERVRVRAVVDAAAAAAAAAELATTHAVASELLVGAEAAERGALHGGRCVVRASEAVAEAEAIVAERTAALARCEAHTRQCEAAAAVVQAGGVAEESLTGLNSGDGAVTDERAAGVPCEKKAMASATARMQLQQAAEAQRAAEEAVTMGTKRLHALRAELQAAIAALEGPSAGGGSGAAGAGLGLQTDGGGAAAHGNAVRQAALVAAELTHLRDRVRNLEEEAAARDVVVGEAVAARRSAEEALQVRLCLVPPPDSAGCWIMGEGGVRTRFRIHGKVCLVSNRPTTSGAFVCLGRSTRGFADARLITSQRVVSGQLASERAAEFGQP